MQQKIKFENIVKTLVLLHCILFVGLYLLLGYYNRLGRDEGLCIYFLNKLGLIQTIKYYYLTQEGNFSSLIIATTLLQIFKNNTNIFIFHFFTLSLLYLSLYFFIDRLYQLKLVSSGRFYKYVTPLLILSPFFLLNPKVSEVWFWFGAMVVYLIPLIFLLFGCYFLFSDNKIFKSIGFLLLLLFGGAKINYGIMIATIFGLYFLYNLVIKKKINKTSILAFLAISIGSIIYVAAPGNLNRMSKETIGLNWGNLSHAIVYDIRYVVTGFFSPGVALRLIVLMTPFLLAGIKLKDKKLDGIVFTKYLWLLIIVVNVGLLIENCLVYFLSTGEGVLFPRVMAINFFILTLSFALVFAYLGNKLELYINNKGFKLLAALLLLYPCFAYAKSFRTEVYKAKNLAESFDKRVAILKSCKGKKIPGGILYLDSLSEQGITNSLEISTDTANKNNEQYVLRYGLDFKIAVKKCK